MTKSRRYLGFLIWTFSSLLKTSHQFGLTIDNQLAIIADDCYTRISIGTKLPASSSFLTIRVATVSDCEEECSKKRNSCDVFSFGIDLKGNATCTLGASVPNFRDLQPDPDYDVYVRSQRTPRCESDRIYKFEGSLDNQRKNASTSVKAISSSFLRAILPNNRQPPWSGNDGMSKYQSYSHSTDDDRRIFDILTNKKHPPAESDGLKSDFLNAEQEDFPEISANRAPYELGEFRHFRGWVPLTLKQNQLTPHERGNSSVFDDDHGRRPWQFNSNFHRNLGGERFEDNSTYDFPHLHGFSMNAFDNYKDSGYRFGDRIRQKVKPCYRRLLSGKKIHEMYVRRAIECQTIDDCHRACDYEKLFDCTGFNYRKLFPLNGPRRREGEAPRGICELTSTPYPRMDVHRDFATDPQCDFYEKDLSCRPRTYGSGHRPPWSYDYSSRPVPRPPSRPPSRPYDIDQRFSNQLPRPLDYYPNRPTTHDDGPSVYASSYQPNDPYHQKPYPADRTYSEDSYILSRWPDNRHYYRRPYPTPSYTDRRMDYGPYHHRDTGTNQVGPYPVAHRKDHNSRYWPTYGAVYGSSYPHNTNTIGNFNTKELSRQPGGPVQRQPPRPYENDHFYSEFYHYGGAFGYGGNYAPSYKDLIYGGSEEDRDCSIRAGAGFKLGRAIVRKSFLTPNLDQCESLCVTDKTFLCMTFAYRYNVAATDPTDNCLLTDVAYRDLNFYTDLVPDHDYDIYAVIGDAKTCNAGKPSGQHPADECFWRVRSGYGMPTDVTRKAINAQGIGDCQIECTLSQDFTCRSFAFRYSQRGERRSNGSLNCYLSDWPPQEIDPANMPDVDGAELYERGSFGRGCEPYSLPSLHAGRFADNKPLRENQGCYAGYHRPCKLTPYAVLVATRADSEADCREKCTRMRTRDTNPCMSFSFRVRGNGIEENCLLSDVPIRDLRPGLDYMYDSEHVLYAWRDLDPRCYISTTASTADDEHVHGVGSYGLGRPLPPGPPYAPDVGSPGPGSNSPGYSYGPGSRPNGHGYGYGPIGNAYDAPGVGYPNGGGVRPLDPDRPDPIGPHYHLDVPRPLYGSGGQSPYDGIYAHAGKPLDPHKPDSYRPILGQHAHGGFTTDQRPPDRPTFPYLDDFLYTSRHYTVNGYPCKRGSRCEKNEIAGFWSCEIEGGASFSWDYCCAPNNRCGYSRGFHYPWCYVGPSEDQWRPCSEKYYPYLPSPRPLRPKQHRYEEADDARFYTGSSLPDYSARHWPVIYIHGAPPPNCTDSIASAAAQLPATRRLNDTTNYATTQYLTMANAAGSDRNEGRQLRRRRLRARTISSADRIIVKNQHSENPRDRNFTEEAGIQRVQLRAPFNNTDLLLPENHQNQTYAIGTRKRAEISAQVKAAPRAGTIERIEKPSNGRESLFSRAINTTSLPVV